MDHEEEVAQQDQEAEEDERTSTELNPQVLSRFVMEDTALYSETQAERMDYSPPIRLEGNGTAAQDQAKDPRDVQPTAPLSAQRNPIPQQPARR